LYYLYELKEDQGAVVQLDTGEDSDVFTQEEGIVVDIQTTESNFWFEDDTSIITTWYEDDMAVILWYVADPEKDKLELGNIELALRYYCLWRCYQKDDTETSAGKANYFYGLYKEEIKRSNARELKKLPPLKAYYF